MEIYSVTTLFENIFYKSKLLPWLPGVNIIPYLDIICNVLQVIATRLDTIASRLEAIATRLEAIATKLELGWRQLLLRCY